MTKWEKELDMIVSRLAEKNDIIDYRLIHKAKLYLSSTAASTSTILDIIMHENYLIAF